MGIDQPDPTNARERVHLPGESSRDRSEAFRDEGKLEDGERRFFVVQVGKDALVGLVNESRSLVHDWCRGREAGNGKIRGPAPPMNVQLERHHATTEGLTSDGPQCPACLVRHAVNAAKSGQPSRPLHAISPLGPTAVPSSSLYTSDKAEESNLAISQSASAEHDTPDIMMNLDLPLPALICSAAHLQSLA